MAFSFLPSHLKYMPISYLSNACRISHPSHYDHFHYPNGFCEVKLLVVQFYTGYIFSHSHKSTHSVCFECVCMCREAGKCGRYSCQPTGWNRGICVRFMTSCKAVVKNTSCCALTANSLCAFVECTGITLHLHA